MWIAVSLIASGGLAVAAVAVAVAVAIADSIKGTSKNRS